MLFWYWSEAELMDMKKWTWTKVRELRLLVRTRPVVSGGRTLCIMTAESKCERSKLVLERKSREGTVTRTGTCTLYIFAIILDDHSAFKMCCALEPLYGSRQASLVTCRCYYGASLPAAGTFAFPL